MGPFRPWHSPISNIDLNLLRLLHSYCVNVKTVVILSSGNTFSKWTKADIIEISIDRIRVHFTPTAVIPNPQLGYTSEELNESEWIIEICFIWICPINLLSIYEARVESRPRSYRRNIIPIIYFILSLNNCLRSCACRGEQDSVQDPDW